ncbi:MAG TPA: P-loop NTPase fold protein [Pyrinomonadaceae bacterium]|jgi:hypothetical protein|nr:P-loop NTPase fold protein [Pyrinomonadaceae bacterium]
MSLEHIKAVIENFISDTRNELLVIKGKWGAGKTFFWQKLIEECQREKNVGRQFYSYVSLFGVNSLEELNNSILASRVDSNPNKVQKTFDSLTTNLKALAAKAEKVPALREYTGGLISSFLHLLLDNTLVCFDDLERRGDELSVKDVFGLASVLKEQRGCKVVLILNEEGLGDAQGEFRLHGEKIIDREIRFSITYEEAFGYVFLPSFPRRDFIKGCCVTLNIENLRTLQRVKRFTEDINPHLRGSDEGVAEDVLRSLILMVWSHYEEASGAPSLEFILSYSSVNRYLAEENKKEISPEEKKWNEVMSSYGPFRSTSFDKTLAEFIATGYVDKQKLLSELEKENKLALSLQGQASFRKAWDIYHSSFKDNEQEFVDTLVSSFRSNIAIMSLENLASVASMLREFERGDLANSLVDEYFGQHNSEENIAAIRMARGTIFVRDINDPYLLSRLNDIWNSDEFDKRSLADVVQALTGQSGWNEDDIRRLDSFAADDYYNFFKAIESPNLYHYVRTCLDFGQIQGGNEMYKSIGEKAEVALRRLALESRINRMRVSRMFKIQLDES